VDSESKPQSWMLNQSSGPWILEQELRSWILKQSCGRGIGIGIMAVDSEVDLWSWILNQSRGRGF
jgi:hypothetical protein